LPIRFTDGVDSVSLDESVFGSVFAAVVLAVDIFVEGFGADAAVVRDADCMGRGVACGLDVVRRLRSLRALCTTSHPERSNKPPTRV